MKPEQRCASCFTFHISSFADLQQRTEQVRALLPRVWEVAEAILAANPDIEEADLH